MIKCGLCEQFVYTDRYMYGYCKKGKEKGVNSDLINFRSGATKACKQFKMFKEVSDEREEKREQKRED